MAQREPGGVSESVSGAAGKVYPYPIPTDDGAADHLVGCPLPSLTLAGTGGPVDLSGLRGTLVVYAYTMMGAPNLALPGDWDVIPGAHGSTPQAEGYRDRLADLSRAGADAVLGVSTQPEAEQREAHGRLALNHPLLSDADLALASALDLPTFGAGGRTLLRRVTMVVRDGAIVHARYPVHPPADDAAAVLDWLRANPAG